MSRYFCHTCDRRIERINDDFTCPSCSQGFIEEIDESQQHEHQQQQHQATVLNPLDILQLIGLVPQQSGGGGGGGFPVNSMRFSSPRAHPSPGTPTSTSSTDESGTTPNSTSTATPAGASGNSPSPNLFTSGRTRGGTPHFSFVIDGRTGGVGGGNSEVPVENMFLTFITDLITGLGGGQQQNLGGLGFPLSGNINLGDYAWGREGFDAIVTQLMNNMEGTGPPPLSTERISELIYIRISKEQVDCKLQCSVCWEDFEFDENVIRLDCEHVYHSDCILPWLKLHATCPVCRKDLNTSSPEEQQPQQQTNPNTSNSTSALDEDMEFD